VRVDGTGGAAAMVKIDRAESDHRAEGTIPLEGRKLQGQFGVGLELQAVGGWSFLY